MYKGMHCQFNVFALCMNNVGTCCVVIKRKLYTRKKKNIVFLEFQKKNPCYNILLYVCLKIKQLNNYCYGNLMKTLSLY